jgi:excisionase family DNA binding protein
MSNSNAGLKSPISPLLRIEQVAELLGCSERHVRNLHREGRMPPRIAISERLVGWRESDLETWLTSRREDGSDV